MGYLLAVRIPFVVLTAVAFALVAACSAAPQADVSDAGLVMELRDYVVKPNLATVKAGKVKIGIRNTAGMTHNLIVLKTETPNDKLAIDGGAAKAKEEGKVGGIDTIGGGRVAALTLDLPAGSYVAICNIAGHYQLGMHAAFKVE